MSTDKFHVIFAIFILALCINTTLIESGLQSTCKICLKCSSCQEQLKKDTAIDYLHQFLQQKFPSKLINYPLSIKRVYLTATDVEYWFIYNTGLSIILRLNKKSGDIQIVSHENKITQPVDSNCSKCNNSAPGNASLSNTTSVAFNNSTNNTLSNSPNSSLSIAPSFVSTQPNPLSLISSFALFFSSTKQIPLMSASMQLLNNFIYRKFFSTPLFIQLSVNAELPKAANLKMIYYKTYSIKYFRLIYVFLNEKATQKGLLEFYEIIISQQDSGYTLIQNTKVNDKQLSWVDISPATTNSSPLIALCLRSQRIIDSSRFDIKTVNLSVSAAAPTQQSNVTQNSTSTQTTTTSQQQQQYGQIASPQQSKQVQQLQSFLSQYFHLTYKRLQLRKVQKQSITRITNLNKSQITSYRLTYRVTKSLSLNTQPLHYEIILTKFIKQNGKVNFELLNANYINLLPLSQIKVKLQSSLLTQQQVGRDGNIPFIDSLVLNEFSQQLGRNAPITKIKRYEPYYELTYIDLMAKEIKITLMYEMIMNTMDFYVQGKKSLTSDNNNQEYEVLTDSGKRTQGTVVIGDNRTSSTSTTNTSTTNNYNPNNNVSSSTNTKSNSETARQSTSVSSIIFASSQLPDQKFITWINYSQFKLLPYYQSSQQVGRIVQYLLIQIGQGISYFMKLNQVLLIQNFTNTTNIYRLVFEIKRYEQLTQQALHFVQQPLFYEIIVGYDNKLSTTSTAPQPTISLLTSQYICNYCFFPKNILINSILGQLSSLMTYDSTNLLSDQYYLNVNQLLLRYEIPSNSNNKAFKELIKSAFVKRVGRLLPFYWVEYNNGVTVLLSYQVVAKEISVIMVSALVIGSNTQSFISGINSTTKSTSTTNTVNKMSASVISNKTSVTTISGTVNNISVSVNANNSSTQKTANNTPVIVNNTPVIVNNTPVIVNNTPVIVNNTPVIVNNTPVIVNNTPVIANNTPVIVNNTPVIVNNTPVIVNNTPVIVNNTPVSSTSIILIKPSQQNNITLNTSMSTTVDIRNTSNKKFNDFTTNNSTGSNNSTNQSLKNGLTSNQDVLTSNNNTASKNKTILIDFVVKQAVDIKQVTNNSTGGNTNSNNSINSTKPQSSSNETIIIINKSKLVDDKQSASLINSNSGLVQVKQDTSVIVNGLDKNALKGQKNQSYSKAQPFTPIVTNLTAYQKNQIKPTITTNIAQNTVVNSNNSIIQSKDNTHVVNLQGQLRNQKIQLGNKQVDKQIIGNGNKLIQPNNLTSTNNSNSKVNGNSSQQVNVDVVNSSSLVNRQPNSSSTATVTNSQTTASNTSQPTAMRQPLTDISLSSSNSQLMSRRQLIQNSFRVNTLSEIYLKKINLNVNLNKLMTINLLPYERLPAVMLNDFMSPYYLIFREDYLKRTFLTSNGTNQKSNQYSLTKFTQVFLYQFVLYRYGAVTQAGIKETPAFQIIISHDVYQSGFRVVVSCSSLKKVYQIVFLSFNYYVMSFKEIQSLKDLTVGVNQKLFDIQSSFTRDGSPIQPIRQFQMVKNYGNIIRMLIRDIEIQQVRQVKLSFLPQGIKFYFSYIASSQILVSSGERELVKKQWFSTEVVYSIEAQSFSLVKHQVYRRGVNLNDKKVMLFSNLNSEASPALVSQSKIREAKQSALTQARLIVQRASDSMRMVSLIQVYQATGQPSQEAYVLTKFQSISQVPIRLIFLYSFHWQRIISLESILVQNELYKIQKSFLKQQSQLSPISFNQKLIVQRVRQISSKLFKNQPIPGQNTPQLFSCKLGESIGSKQTLYYKFYFNSPALYQIIFRVTVDNSPPKAVMQSLQFMGTRRLSEWVIAADQFYDQNNRQSQGYESMQLSYTKNDNRYKMLYDKALKKYTLIGSARIYALYQKQTVQQLNFKVILQHSSEINILQMKVNKFSMVSHSVSLILDPSFPLTGFYLRDCVKQSVKGYCVICTNQFGKNIFVLSNGRCYPPINKCQAQLAYKCILCSNGYELNENNKCVLSNVIDLSTYTQALKVETTYMQSASKSSSQRICKTFDIKGSCIQCPDDEIYVLVDNVCLLRNVLSSFVSSNFERKALIMTQTKLTQQRIDIINSDQFCRRWINNICVDCIQGTIIVTNKRCQISRQNCLSYNSTVKKCQTCNKDFKNVQGRCLK